MSRKAFLIYLLVISASFGSGITYKSWQESKNITDLDRPLALLLARPTDFESISNQWSHIDYTQVYYDPNTKGVSLEYEIANKHFTIGFSEQHATFNVTHNIKRYRPEELPKKTWIDDVYIEKTANNEMKVRLLNLEELDKNTQAFCVFSKSTSSKTCYVESKYKEIISIFVFEGYNMEEAQIINSITPAIQKFYDRLSKSSIQ
jgi:hypothetical protein